MTGLYVNAFGLVWDVHEETRKVTIQSPLGKGPHQEIRVSIDIVILGGDVIDPYDLCMMKDQGDEELEPEMGYDIESDKNRRKRQNEECHRTEKTMSEGLKMK